jgi:hypothetical protein
MAQKDTKPVAPEPDDDAGAPELVDELEELERLRGENVELRAALAAALAAPKADDNRARFRMSEGARLDGIEQARDARLADSNITRNVLKTGK